MAGLALVELVQPSKLERFWDASAKIATSPPGFAQQLQGKVAVRPEGRLHLRTVPGLWHSHPADPVSSTSRSQVRPITAPRKDSRQIAAVDQSAVVGASDLPRLVSACGDRRGDPPSSRPRHLWCATASSVPKRLAAIRAIGGRDLRLNAWTRTAGWSKLGAACLRSFSWIPRILKPWRLQRSRHGPGRVNTREKYARGAIRRC